MSGVINSSWIFCGIIFFVPCWSTSLSTSPSSHFSSIILDALLFIVTKTTVFTSPSELCSHHFAASCRRPSDSASPASNTSEGQSVVGFRSSGMKQESGSLDELFLSNRDDFRQESEEQELIHIRAIISLIRSSSPRWGSWCIINGISLITAVSSIWSWKNLAYLGIMPSSCAFLISFQALLSTLNKQRYWFFAVSFLRLSAWSSMSRRTVDVSEKTWRSCIAFVVFSSSTRCFFPSDGDAA